MNVVQHTLRSAKGRIWPAAKSGEYLLAARRRLFAAICVLIGISGVTSGTITGLQYFAAAPLIAVAGVLVPFMIGVLPFLIRADWSIDKFAFGVLSALYVHMIVMVSAPSREAAIVYFAAIPVLFGLLVGFRAGVLSGIVTIGTIAVLANSVVPWWMCLTTGILTFGLTLGVCIFQREIEHTTAYLIARDIEVTDATQHQQETNQLLQQTLSNIEQGIVVYAADMRMIAWNDNYEQLMEFPKGWLHSDRTIEDYYRFNAMRGEYGEIDAANVDEAVQRRMRELHFDGVEITPHRYVRRRPNGRSIEIIGNPMPDGGLVVTFADITDKEEARLAIERLAWTDSLTELFNRNSLRSTIVRSMKIVRRANKRLALLMLDLDRFKPVNDTYGHAAGDEILRVIAERLKENIRASDYAFRLGGDEFAALVFLSLGDAEIYDMMPRLLQRLRAPVVFEGREISVGASIGISFFPNSDENPDELVRKADIALYEAKESGRNCYRIYDELVDHKAQKQRRYEDDLRDAVNRKEFELDYLAKYCLKSDTVNGAEALIRWRHPEFGRIPPDEFMPIVERGDLVFPVGAWVLTEAWRQAHKWTQDHPALDFLLSANISARLFFDASLMRLLRELAASRPDLAARIDLEITEEVTVGDVDEAARIIQQINDLGFKISIDDFGTGYSSISYLHKLPVHRIKIDKSFLDSFSDGGQSETVIKSMIELGHNLGMKVVAEGVETQEQFDFLRDNHCDEIQGYFISKPTTVDAFSGMLSGKQIAERRRA